jgi:hypothetical protein
MSHCPSRPVAGLAAVAAASVTLLMTLLATPAAAEPRPIEDYPSYEPASHCARTAKPGTVALGDWLVRRYGGGFGGILRRCHGGGTSEHNEGRAFDWTVSVRSRADRKRVNAFLDDLFATDRAGNEHARARRMGVMYVIWNDHMYSAWDRYAGEPYRNSSCPRIRTCSATLRHRDHVHVSLTRRAARGGTSWYAGRL